MKQIRSIVETDEFEKGVAKAKKIMADKRSNLLQLNPASEPSDKHQSMTADVETEQRELDALNVSCSLALANRDGAQSRDNRMPPSALKYIPPHKSIQMSTGSSRGWAAHALVCRTCVFCAMKCTIQETAH